MYIILQRIILKLRKRSQAKSRHITTFSSKHRFNKQIIIRFPLMNESNSFSDNQVQIAVDFRWKLVGANINDRIRIVVIFNDAFIDRRPVKVGRWSRSRGRRRHFRCWCRKIHLTGAVGRRRWRGRESRGNGVIGQCFVFVVAVLDQRNSLLSDKCSGFRVHVKIGDLHIDLCTVSPFVVDVTIVTVTHSLVIDILLVIDAWFKS